MTPRQPVKRKWSKGGRLIGRPPGSRSYDPATSRADDPPMKPPERRGRPKGSRNRPKSQEV